MLQFIKKLLKKVYFSAIFINMTFIIILQTSSFLKIRIFKETAEVSEKLIRKTKFPFSKNKLFLNINRRNFLLVINLIFPRGSQLNLNGIGIESKGPWLHRIKTSCFPQRLIISVLRRIYFSNFYWSRWKAKFCRNQKMGFLIYCSRLLVLGWYNFIAYLFFSLIGSIYYFYFIGETDSS